MIGGSTQNDISGKMAVWAAPRRGRARPGGLEVRRPVHAGGRFVWGRSAVSDIKFVVITGLSGAGKSEAMKCFEDLGFFCVDNLPPALIPKFAELCAHSEGTVNKIALVSDIRGGRFFDALEDSLGELEKIGFSYEILFLEASDAVLVRRFKETRRRHPLAPEGAILDAIAEERRRLEGIRGRAHRIIDTSAISPRQLHKEIAMRYQDPGKTELMISVVSFGFKHGLPLDADLVFDVRFLPNPHYVESLKPLSGKDPEVFEYVFKWPVSERFFELAANLLLFLLPQYVQEGKAHLVVAVGCTGGRHRSVAVAERLGRLLQDKGYRAGIEHRDVEKVSDPTYGLAQ